MKKNKGIKHFKPTEYHYAKQLCGADHPQVHLLFPHKLKKHKTQEGGKELSTLIPPDEFEQVEDHVRPERANHNYRADSRRFRKTVNKQVKVFDKIKLDEDISLLIKQSNFKQTTNLRNKRKKIAKLYTKINKLRYERQL